VAKDKDKEAVSYLRRAETLLQGRRIGETLKDKGFDNILRQVRQLFSLYSKGF
jgi:hypothetical protein